MNNKEFLILSEVDSRFSFKYFTNVFCTDSENRLRTKSEMKKINLR